MNVRWVMVFPIEAYYNTEESTNFRHNYTFSIVVLLDRVVDGQAPVKVIAKVNEWIDLHEAEILTLWEKAQKGEKLNKIEPLK